MAYGDPGFAYLKAITTYPAWRRSQSVPFEHGPLQDEIPWITFEAFKFLKRLMHPSMRVFEYGSGGSTVFWSKCTQQVFSVENDIEWFNLMRSLISNRGIDNVKLSLVEPDERISQNLSCPEDPTLYESASPLHKNHSFESYVSTIDQFQDQSFDIVFIDGRARASCIVHSCPKIKHGGWLILDNSERNYYTMNTSILLKDWPKYRFFGPIPYLKYFSETTFWCRPNT